MICYSIFFSYPVESLGKMTEGGPVFDVPKFAGNKQQPLWYLLVSLKIGGGG